LTELKAQTKHRQSEEEQGRKFFGVSLVEPHANRSEREKNFTDYKYKSLASDVTARAMVRVGGARGRAVGLRGARR
jgi:hypothetical protein